MSITRAVFLAVPLAAMLGVPTLSAAQAGRQAGPRANVPATKQAPQAPDPAVGAGQEGVPMGRPGGPGRGAPINPDSMRPVEIEQLFDANMILQAQQMLNLSEEQFLRFAQRVRNLQNIRRRVQREHRDLIAELRRLTTNNGQPPDQNAIMEKVKALDDLPVRSAPEIRQAYIEIDQVLNFRQRARFRVIEDQMEQRKLDLIAAARRNQQGRGQPQGPVVKK